MDYSAMMRGAGGMMGGMGQAMMTPEFRKTYGTARSGGFGDLMENQQIGDFVHGGVSPQLTQRFQVLRAKMQPAMRGVPSGVPGTGATGYNQ